MKKALIITAFVVGVGFLGLRQASAYWGMGDGPGMGHGCFKGGPCYSQLDAAAKEKVDKFYNETKEIRKQIVMKHAEERAIMHSENPDPAKAAKLAGEIFDLGATLESKADAAGVSGLINCGNYDGPRHGMGPRGAGKMKKDGFGRAGAAPAGPAEANE